MRSAALLAFAMLAAAQSQIPVRVWQEPYAQHPGQSRGPGSGATAARKKAKSRRKAKQQARRSK